MRYANIVVSSIRETLAYRIEFFSRMGSALINLVVMWFVWVSIFSASASGEIGGFTLQAMMTYLVISSVIKAFLGTNMDSAMEEDVKSGRISTILIKPVSYPLFRVSKGLSSPIVSLAFNSVPIFFVSVFFLGISITSSVIPFLLSFFLGFTVNYLITFLIGLWSFWSEGSIWGIRLSKEIISEILSGSIIPLSMFPSSIVGIANLLPFQTIFNLPISIYLGRIAGIDILYSILQQLFWIGLLSIVCYLIWKRAEKKIVIHGG
jgi:ABC-2 type transport system permease protein